MSRARQVGRGGTWKNGSALTQRLRARTTLAGMLLLVVVAGHAGLASAAHDTTRLPKLLGDNPKRIGYLTWQTRPAHILYTGDGSGILGGLDGTGARDPGHLKWSIWTTTEAKGSGAVWLDDCNPDCADGKYAPYAVRVHAFHVVNGRFLRLTLEYTMKGKHYIDRRGIWRTGGYWSYYIVDSPQ